MQISPSMTHPPSRLYLSDIRHGVPCKFRALTIYAALPRRAASYPLPVRQASALPSASSRFAVARDTLAVQLTLPLAGRVEDFHLQVSAPCRAHVTESGAAWLRRPGSIPLSTQVSRFPAPACGSSEPLVLHGSPYLPGIAIESGNAAFQTQRREEIAGHLVFLVGQILTMNAGRPMAAVI